MKAAGTCGDAAKIGHERFRCNFDFFKDRPAFSLKPFGAVSQVQSNGYLNGKAEEFT